MPEFPSREWLDVYVERINGSAEYREAAANWEGDISYVFEAEPDKGVPEEIWAWLDLWHGECREARYGVSPEEGEQVGQAGARVRPGAGIHRPPPRRPELRHRRSAVMAALIRYARQRQLTEVMIAGFACRRKHDPGLSQGR